MGESGNSGRNPGWDGNGKMATIPNEFRRVPREVPELRSGLEMGEFFSCKPGTFGVCRSSSGWDGYSQAETSIGCLSKPTVGRAAFERS